ncbi:MAG: InlB B-repeat-containing protein, partial [Tannerella sp.]|nr:InlB B-repeat-containing protein [Tannerella sp.]
MFTNIYIMRSRLVSCILLTALFAAMFTSCEKDEENEVPTYTVTFNSKGGSQITPQTVREGDRIEKPVDPIRENYSFSGWATADNETSPLWNFETGTVTSDIALYARWAISTYTVTFDSDGGSTVPAQNIAHGSTATKPSDPTRNGHMFDGWFNGDAVWNFSTAITASITLKARWTPAYTVTFDSDGGSTVPNQNIRNGNTATRPADPTKAWTPQSGLYRGTPPPSGNYTFTGWYNGETLWNFDNVITGDLVLKAKWQGDFNLSRIESVLSNDITAAVTYVNANSNNGEEYTLLIGANVTVGAQMLSAANATLTIMGIESEKSITSISSSSYGRLFTINGNNSTHLAIGKNITLKSGGGSGLVSVLVNIQRGSLTMYDGSKITEEPPRTGFVNSAGAVLVSGINSSFKMEGGEISGMKFGTENCAISVSDGGLFEMSGGSVTDNSSSYGVNDIYIDYNGVFRLSGNARIGTLWLTASNATTRSV